MRASAIIVVVTFAITAAVACTKDKAPEVKGAAYASQIPLHPSAKLDDIFGGSYYEELGGEAKFESQTWFYKTTESPTVLAAFYENRLPAGSRQDDDEGAAVFEFKPNGSEEGEEVKVRIEPGKLNITEVVKPGKRKE